MLVLSVTIKSIILSVFMLNIVAPTSFDVRQTFFFAADEEANKLECLSREPLLEGLQLTSSLRLLVLLQN
jgi:hypothetical protein